MLPSRKKPWLNFKKPVWCTGWVFFHVTCALLPGALWWLIDASFWKGTPKKTNLWHNTCCGGARPDPLNEPSLYAREVFREYINFRYFRCCATWKWSTGVGASGPACCGSNKRVWDADFSFFPTVSDQPASVHLAAVLSETDLKMRVPWNLLRALLGTHDAIRWSCWLSEVQLSFCCFWWISFDLSGVFKILPGFIDSRSTHTIASGQCSPFALCWNVFRFSVLSAEGFVSTASHFPGFGSVVRWKR